MIHHPQSWYRSWRPRGAKALVIAVVVIGLIGLGVPATSPGAPSDPAGPEWSCETADECFKSVVALRNSRGTPDDRDRLLSIKAQRLRTIMERYPASLWAKRAGLLLGVLLIDREPGEAIRQLKGAQRDFPHLDDYLRLWTGESLLNLNDATAAATMFQSIGESVPDSTLLLRAAYRTGDALFLGNDCPAATDWFGRALAINDKDAAAPMALLRLGECHTRAGRPGEARAAFKQIWIRFPQTAEARDARAHLDAAVGEEAWRPSADDHYQRALAFSGQAMHTEAIEEFRRFLSLGAQDPRRFEARLRLGTAQARLKQYEQAREMFRQLSTEGVPESREAIVWLARVYLRQGAGDKLLELARSAQNGALSGDQKATIHLFAGIWLEDEGRYDEAIAAYRLVAKFGETATQRAEGQWRVGWVQYRIARYAHAAESFAQLAEGRVAVYEPQALYWLGRASELARNGKAGESYRRVCQGYEFSYYCQLASQRVGQTSGALQAVPVSADRDSAASLPESRRPEIERHPAYRRAIELKMLGLGQDAARELAALTDRYRNDEDVLLALSALLNEVGAYHPALRLAKTHFRDKLERGGHPASSILWTVAYPTGLVPTIQAQGVPQVNPYLAAAIIREESQYDEKALSMVGAVGLMQLMPITANQVAQRFGFSAVERDDLYDQMKNIQLGVRYLGQLLDQFSGNVAHAVAAYNAGPTAVSHWIAMHRGREQDEFIELIPYQETRLYVKRVLRSFGEYLRLNQSSSRPPLS